MKRWQRNFAIIWAGQFLSLLSSATVAFAIILWISMETRSAEMLAYAAIAALLPQALTGPVSGVFIDRWDRKRTMIVADSFIALCTLVLAFLFWAGIARMVHIFILLALRSVWSAFHAPAMQASVPLLAPEAQLTRIAGINQIIISVSNMAGPALGALLFTLFKIELVLMVDVFGALAACTSLLFIRIPNPKRGKERISNVMHEMKAGLTAIMHKKGLRWVCLFSVLCFFFIMPVSVLFPLITIEHFKGNAYQVSLIEILWGVGSLVGGIILGAKTYRFNKVILLNITYIILGITFSLSGMLSPGGFVFFAILTAIGGVAGSFYHAAFTATIQSHVDPGVLGRVFSMFYSVTLIPSMIALIGIGFFADYLGITLSFVICGAAIALTGVAAFTTPSALRMDRPSLREKQLSV